MPANRLKARLYDNGAASAFRFLLTTAATEWMAKRSHQFLDGELVREVKDSKDLPW